MRHFQNSSGVKNFNPSIAYEFINNHCVDDTSCTCAGLIPNMLIWQNLTKLLGQQ